MTTTKKVEPFLPNLSEEWAHISFGGGWTAGLYPTLSESCVVVAYTVLFYLDDDGRELTDDTWAASIPLGETVGGARAALEFAMDIAALADAEIWPESIDAKNPGPWARVGVLCDASGKGLYEFGIDTNPFYKRDPSPPARCPKCGITVLTYRTDVGIRFSHHRTDGSLV